jgi:hypothetical protein
MRKGRSRRPDGVIDRDDPAGALNIAQQCIPAWDSSAPDSEIEHRNAAEQVGVTVECRNLAPRYQQQIIEVRLQPAHRVRM